MDDPNCSVDMSLASNAFAHLICQQGADIADNAFEGNTTKRLEDVFDQVALEPLDPGTAPADGLKVAVRVRPLGSHEGGEKTVKVVAEQCLRTIAPATSLAAKLSKQPGRVIKDYVFSRVMDDSVSQTEVFNFCVEPMVNSFLAGSSCLLFAYGMTGAGKTYTIVGDSANPGIVPQLLRRAFKTRGQKDATFTMSCLEIYQETIYDLLTEEDRKTALKLVHVNGVAVAKNLSAHPISSAEEGTDLLSRALRRRTVASHALNKESSRSHCLCTIKVHRKNGKVGVFNLVDLAGSERGERTGSVSVMRQREANAINTSLMILWRCLQHVRKQSGDSSDPNATSILPFRESKLTHLLMHQISQSDPQNTMMIVNISPAAGDFDETQHVLSNAALASEIRGVCEYSLKGLGREAEIRSRSAGLDRKKRKLDRLPSSNALPVAAALAAEGMPQDGKDAGGARASKVARTVQVDPVDAAELKRLQDENRHLREQVELLMEKVADTEFRVRNEVVREMSQRTEELLEENERLNDELRELRTEDRIRSALTASAKKWQRDRLDGFIAELQDRAEESEAELRRREEEHAAEIAELEKQLALLQAQNEEQHAQLLALKDKEEVAAAAVAAAVATQQKSEEISAPLPVGVVTTTKAPAVLSPRKEGAAGNKRPRKQKNVVKDTVLDVENVGNAELEAVEVASQASSTEVKKATVSAAAKKATPMKRRLRSRSKPAAICI